MAFLKQLFTGDNFKFIVNLDKINEDEVTLIGVKGTSLARLVHNNLPVPAGFIVTTEASKQNVLTPYSVKDNLRSELESAVQDLEDLTGRVFYRQDENGGMKSDPSDPVDSAFPLLLSVRESPVARATQCSSGTRRLSGGSNTVLNVGMNKEVCAIMKKMTMRPLFVLDTYRRFVEDYGEHVLGIPHSRYASVMEDFVLKYKVDTQQGRFLPHINQFSLSQMQALVDCYISFTPIPQDPSLQLLRAVEAVLGRFESVSARMEREHHGIPDLGTAVIVQSMVYGNLTALGSGSGTVCSRSPVTGEDSLYGHFMSKAEGEDTLLQGLREIDVHKELQRLQPAAYAALKTSVKTLEADMKDLALIDFTVENGELFLLRCDAADRTAAAAVKIAVDMATPASLSMSDDVEATAANRGTIGGVNIRRGGCLKALITRSEALVRAPVHALPNGNDPVWARNSSFSTLLRWADELRDVTVLVSSTTPQDLLLAAELGADGAGLVSVSEVVEQPALRSNLLAVRSAQSQDDCELALALLGPKLKEALQMVLMNVPCPISARSKPQDANRHVHRTVNVMLSGLGPPGSFIAPMVLELYFETQAKALVSAVLETQIQQGCLFNLNIMLPELLPGQQQGMLYRVQSGTDNATQVFDAMSHLHNMGPEGVKHMLHAKSKQGSGKDSAAMDTREERKSVEIGQGHVHMSTSPPTLQQLSGAFLNVHFGATVATPRACIQAGSLATTGISFLCFDLDRLTELVHGCLREDFPMTVGDGEEQSGIPPMVPLDPFYCLERDGVGDMLRAAINRARKVNDGLRVVVMGEMVAHPDSLLFLQQKQPAGCGVDAITVPAAALPAAKIASAKATVQLRMSPDKPWSWADAFGVLDNEFLDDQFMRLM